LLLFKDAVLLYLRPQGRGLFLPLCHHAPAEVKAAADYVTLDIDHGGLAEAIKKFLL